MLKTAQQAIEWLNKTYGNDLEQPIFITTIDRTDLWEWFGDSDEIQNLNVHTAKELPIDMVESVFDNIAEWDKYWESTREIVDSEVSEWIEKENEKKNNQEQLEKLEQELWGDTNEG